ncbi:hypothetical protein SISNIDRAFT_486020 [Sistotremastrum niveocremeum HHB9708]|uniref:Mediator of RNA polymerase II transcription subunit 5 n=1 Tax=Sistotremastrum niveocremeum HHB9708 TaxID=1314777 RepID=A0A164UBQ7_9AGAM|nr:hypothetical protein SISNIDRAFT_486020 [Sistotremastrum niveocremeum HHB9708]
MSDTRAVVDKITRASFLSGASSAKWISFLQTYEHEGASGIPDERASAICGALFSLFPSYPSEALVDYSRHALVNDLVPLSSFVVHFLRAARNPMMHNTATIDLLVRLILERHYANHQLTALGSVVAFNEPVLGVLAMVQDGLWLVRTAYTLPISSFHQPLQPICQLLVLILSCVGDMSHISTNDAVTYYTEASDVLHTLTFQTDLRHSLDMFLVALNLVLGDEAKVARETDLIHAMQMAIGRYDIVAPGVGSDLVSSGLIVYHLLIHRGRTVGCGNDAHSLAMLLALFRSTPSTLAGFCTQILLAAFDILAQAMARKSSVLLHRDFILGRLPRLLKTFTAEVQSDLGEGADPTEALQAAITEIFTNHVDKLNKCEDPVESAAETGPQDRPAATSTSFIFCLLKSLLDLDLIRQPFALLYAPTLADGPKGAQLEAMELGLSPEQLLEQKLASTVALDEWKSLVDRAAQDYALHRCVADLTLKKFASLSRSLDVDQLGTLCKLLSLDDRLLEILSLHTSLRDFVAYGLLFLEDFDYETVGDPQSAVTLSGEVVLFVQLLTYRYQLKPCRFVVDERECKTIYLSTIYQTLRPSTLSPEDRTLFQAWSSALFDKSSEGIEDNLLRMTNPEKLLYLAPSLFSQAIAATLTRAIDLDVLKSGVSYFLGGLLNWTLVGVLNYLIADINRAGFNALCQFEVLQSIFASPGCPKTVLQICGHSLLRLLSDRKLEHVKQRYKVNDTGIRQALSRVFPPQKEIKTPWPNVARNAVQEVIAMSRAGSAPLLNISSCVNTLGPIQFLALLWEGLSLAASNGEHSSARQIGVFCLAAVLPKPHPPLLPIFINNTLPSILTNLDAQIHQQTQSNHIELLGEMLATALFRFLHFERVSQSHMDSGSRSSTQLARMLTSALTRSSSSTAPLVLQRVISSPGFVSNFPGSISTT